VTSFNRNFRGRNDANPETLSFIAGPEMTTAFALSGDLRFNPMTDDLMDADGNAFRLEAPTAPALPSEGFAESRDGFIPPAEDGSGVVVEVDDSSERLQILTPFSAWDGEELTGLRVLLKAKGKCTTDHISPAGKWLKFRGHLDNISNNMFCGAVNAFTDEIGHGTNQVTKETGLEFSAIAREYKAAGVGWVAVGDENYGEGSSREHAAMEPRHLGARAVIVRSFARIHETNLKKQGVLALTFVDATDYDRVRSDDEIDISGLTELAPGSTIRVTLRHADGTTDSLALNHTLNADQITWWKAGSALNHLAGK
jgi:aconitate hydratase